MSLTGPVSRILSWATIYLCGLPGSLMRRAASYPETSSGFLPYLALLRMGFTLPPALPPERCALTTPFHPYPEFTSGRYVFCGTFLMHRFPGTHPVFRRDIPPCGVRTFLSESGSERPPSPVGNILKILNQILRTVYPEIIRGSG